MKRLNFHYGLPFYRRTFAVRICLLLNSPFKDETLHHLHRSRSCEENFITTPSQQELYCEETLHIYRTPSAVTPGEECKKLLALDFARTSPSGAVLFPSFVYLLPPYIIGVFFIFVKPSPEKNFFIIHLTTFARLYHQRKKAAERAGLKTVPCVVKEMDDDEAELAMIDANLETRQLSTMEMARAIRRKKELLGIRRGRPDVNSAHCAELSQKLGIKQGKRANLDLTSDTVSEVQFLKI